MTDDWKPVVYDPTTRQLSAVPDAFAGKPLAVLSIVWRDGMDAGAVIAPGERIATIQWEDYSREPLAAPPDCRGTVYAVNRDIVFEHLEFEPAEWLLILESD